MITAADTNVFFAAVVPSAPGHDRARAFLDAHGADVDFVVSELVLIELYVLLRNPAVVGAPLDAAAAVGVVDALRHHPRWRLVDHDRDVMPDVWRLAAAPGFARGRIFDLRLALGLQRHGVTRFATRNVRHFADLGFPQLVDPLA